MALQRSFKKELAEYRNVLGPVGNDREGLLMVAVLDRWSKHPDVEVIWSKITATVPNLSAQSFIGGVLDAREMCDQERQVLEGLPALVDAARTSAAKDDDADKFEIAAAKRRMAKNLTDRADQLAGRKKESAPRQEFMRMASKMVMDNCGELLDDVVASLTEIAFGKVTDRRAVRDARQAPKRRGDIRTPK